MPIGEWMKKAGGRGETRSLQDAKYGLTESTSEVCNVCFSKEALKKHLSLVEAFNLYPELKQTHHVDERKPSVHRMCLKPVDESNGADGGDVAEVLVEVDPRRTCVFKVTVTLPGLGQRHILHMSAQPPSDRPKCRDLRTEAALRGVERGSDVHIAQWTLQGLFPADSHDGGIALRSIFKLLDEVNYPGKPFSLDSPSVPALKEQIGRIVSWMNIIAASIRKVNHRDKDVLAMFSDIYEENFHIILRWLRFIMREDSWLFNLEAWSGNGVAPQLTVQLLHGLHHDVHTDSLLEMMHSSEEVVDLLLSVWMWKDQKGVAVYLGYDYSRNKPITCPTITLLAQFCMHPTSQTLITDRICAFTGQQYRRFMQCTLSRMEQWKPPPWAQLQSSRAINGLETLIASICGLLTIRSMAKAFVRYNVAGTALRLAIAHNSDIPPRGTDMSRFSMTMGHVLFVSCSTSNTYDLQLCVIVDLLKSGYLNVVLDDAFSRHEAKPKEYPFYTTYTDDKWTDNRSALEYTAQYCVHRRVCEAMRLVIEEIPKTRITVLESGWAAKYWLPFVHTVNLYGYIWDNIPTTQVSLCDNLKHPHTAQEHPATSISAKRCSRCHSVVYCSPACQREDWEIHKVECDISNVRKMSFGNRPVWISHKTRVFFLHLLRQLLLNIFTGHTLLQTGNGTLSGDGFTLSHKHDDAKAGGQSGSLPEQIRVPPVIHFDTREMPLVPKAQDMDEHAPKVASKMLEDLRAEPLAQRNARFETLIEEVLVPISTLAPTSRKEDMGEPAKSGLHRTLAVCLASLGPYVITTFGRFSIACDAESTSVTLLNGYMTLTPEDNRVDGY